MLYSAIAQVGFILMVVVCTLAVVLGDRWGRLSAILHAINWLAVYIFQSDVTQGFWHPDFLVDGLGAMLAGWIAVTSGRLWAAIIAAFQILGVANYLPPLVDPDIRMRTFVATSYVWELGALAGLVWAALEGRACKAHSGADWRSDGR